MMLFFKLATLVSNMTISIQYKLSKAQKFVSKKSPSHRKKTIHYYGPSIFFSPINYVSAASLPNFVDMFLKLQVMLKRDIKRVI